MTATRMPASARRCAREGPDWPVPITIASNAFMPTLLAAAGFRRRSGHASPRTPHAEIGCARRRVCRRGGERVVAGLVQDYTLQGIEVALPWLPLDRTPRVGQAGFPALGDAGRREIDVLGVVLVGQARCQQAHDVHACEAAPAG